MADNASTEGIRNECDIVKSILQFEVCYIANPYLIDLIYHDFLDQIFKLTYTSAICRFPIDFPALNAEAD